MHPISRRHWLAAAPLAAAAQVGSNAPAEFAAFVHQEIGRWAKVVKYSGAKPE